MTLDRKIENEKQVPEKKMHIRSGSIPGKGIYSCTGCSVNWLLNDYEDLPDCPECGGTYFHKQ